MILTDKEIEQRADKCANRYYHKQDTALRIITSHATEHEAAMYRYTDGWKECTEHYRELIEDGMKWKELKNTLSSILEQYPPKEREDNETKGWIAVNIYDILKSMTRKEIEW